MNNDTFMSFIDRAFLKRHESMIAIQQTIPPIKIKGIDSKIHDNSEYVMMNIYVPEKMKKKPSIIHIKIELHLINELKTNILVNMNVMKSKNMILNFEKKILIILTCKKMEVLISIQRKNISINRTMRATVQIIISIETTMTVSMRMRKIALFTNKNYNFFPKIEKQLDSEKKF